MRGMCYRELQLFSLKTKETSIISGFISIYSPSLANESRAFLQYIISKVYGIPVRERNCAIGSASSGACGSERSRSMSRGCLRRGDVAIEGIK